MNSKMDLFNTRRDNEKPAHTSEFAHSLSYQPLAFIVRPKKLEHFFGHERFLSETSPLRHWIENDNMPSVVFWGPPGCGKTTLAEIVAEFTKSYFKRLSAVNAGIKDIKELSEKALYYRKERNTKTVLFLDEIHRFNKAQQDALLPHIESGLITLIGATTENPSFEINSALLSRLKVIKFEAHTQESLSHILKRALTKTSKLILSDDAILLLTRLANGDARSALNILEAILHFDWNDKIEINGEEVKNFLENISHHSSISYDKKGEEHYNTISAFIKSMRSSDPDASIYYLARMLEAGEDPLFIVRRMIIFASEDIGNADPRALQLAIACKEAVHFVGMPEARINLAQTVTYLASAPKSNASYLAISEALSEVRSSGALKVPLHLRNAVTGLMKENGYGKGYQYAHNYLGAKVTQNNLPEEIKSKKFYKPKDIGYEKNYLTSSKKHTSRS